MYKLLQFVLIIAALFLGIWFLKPYLTPTQPHVASVSPAIATPTTIASFTTPYRLEIPSLQINTLVESVGMDAKGNMDTPKDFQQVAWYELGYKPGQKGSSVFAGHFDTPTGDPGVFYDVSTLQAGDTITVTDTKNNILTYSVTEVVSYPLAEFPLQKVFNQTDDAYLTLITCDGIFDKDKKLYDKRLVVYSKLKTT